MKRGSTKKHNGRFEECKALYQKNACIICKFEKHTELTFVLDQSIEYGVHMTGLIDAVANELAAKEPAESSEGKEA